MAQAVYRPKRPGERKTAASSTAESGGFNSLLAKAIAAAATASDPASNTSSTAHQPLLPTDLQRRISMESRQADEDHRVAAGGFAQPLKEIRRQPLILPPGAT